jgi:hypothetical protein
METEFRQRLATISIAALGVVGRTGPGAADRTRGTHATGAGAGARGSARPRDTIGTRTQLTHAYSRPGYDVREFTVNTPSIFRYRISFRLQVNYLLPIRIP